MSLPLQTQQFVFEQRAVRIVDRDGEPWFLLADVCRVMEIGNPSQAASRLDAEEKHTLISSEGDNINGLGGVGAMPTLINESGLYSLILTSRKPEAKRFKRWVTSEVLPSIRKTGSYAAPAALDDPATLRGLLLGYTEKVLALTADNERLVGEAGVLGAKVERMEPKALAHDLLATKTGEENLTDCAKALGRRPGFMFDWWAVNGWLFRKRDRAPWRAYQAKIEAGYLVQREREDPHRPDRSHVQVMVTPKGRAKLAELLAQADMLARPVPV